VIRAAVRPRRLASAAAITLCACAALAAPAWADSGPNLSVRSAALMEESTGQQLFGSSPNDQVPIASTTKLMTALLTLEHVHRLGRIFTQNNYVSSGSASQIGLSPGEQMSVHDLLLAMLLPSADDAAEDLAYNVGNGSVPYFIAMMNVRARQLGLTRTHYSTPIGFDTPGNYSSAWDLVRLARYLLTHQPFFAHAVSLPNAVLKTGDHARVVANRNDLVGQVPWINGVKTGHTLGAGYVLVGSGTQGKMTLISSVLGTASTGDRDSNTLALLNWGFANFRLATPVKDGQVLARPTVRDRPGFRATVIAGGTLKHVVRKSAHLTLQIQVPRELTGPLHRHAVVGTVVVLSNGRAIGRIPLLLQNALAAVSPFAIAARWITRPFTLSVLALLLLTAIALALTMRRRERSRGRGEAGPEPA
jgi:D-alanyl-D-alanine carboxypeptidase (penicillin-binding protein 5/6)